MKTKKEILERLDAIRAELLELEKVESPDEAQATRADELLAEFDGLDEQLRAITEREQRLERVRSHALAHPESRERGTGPDLVTHNRVDPFAGLDNVRAGLVPMEEMQSRALAAIEGMRSATFTDAHRQRATVLAESDPLIARHILLTGSPEYHDEFRRWLRDPVGYRGTALSLTDANGGYLVPYTLDPTLIVTNDGSSNPFRRISSSRSTATDTWSGVTSAGVTAEWLAEATEAAEAGPTIGSLTITPAKAFAEITASFEILADSNFASQLPDLLQDAKDNLEATAFATGSGSGQPKGVITAVTAVTASRVTPTTGGTFTNASKADVYKVINALPARHRSAANWAANFAVINIIRDMDTYGGSAFWANFGGPLVPERLLGLGVYESSAMTATITTGSNILLAGNFTRYLIVDRVGMSVSYDPNVRGSNGRHTGQGQFTAYWRVGADVSDANAFRVLKL